MCAYHKSLSDGRPLHRRIRTQHGRGNGIGGDQCGQHREHADVPNGFVRQEDGQKTRQRIGYGAQRNRQMIGQITVRQTGIRLKTGENAASKHRYDGHNKHQEDVVAGRQPFWGVFNDGVGRLKRLALLARILVLVVVAVANRYRRRILVLAIPQIVEQHKRNSTAGDERNNQTKKHVRTKQWIWRKCDLLSGVQRIWQTHGIATDSLHQREQTGQKSTESLAHQIRNQIDLLESTHVWHKKHRTSTADNRKEEGGRQQRNTTILTSHKCHLLVQCDHAHRGHKSQHVEHVNHVRVVDFVLRILLEERVGERSDVGQLDDDHEVRRKTPSFGRMGYKQRQLQVHRVDTDPRTDAEEDGQEVNPKAAFADYAGQTGSGRFHGAAQQSGALVVCI